MNIFNLADKNSDNLKFKYKALEESHSNQNKLQILNEFICLVKDNWTISINLRPSTVINVLLDGKILNVYELKKEQGRELMSEKSVKKAVETHLKGYYKRRRIFDSTFEDGERFKYAALNIEGIGPHSYGNCCVVIKRITSENYSTLAFIKEDSLNYVDVKNVNIDRLGQDISNRRYVHLLATLKHQDDIENVPKDKWESIICCNECYIDAITTDDIETSHIDSVRLRKIDEDYYFNDLLFKEFMSQELKDSEKLQLQSQRTMRKLLKTKGIKLEVID